MHVGLSSQPFRNPKPFPLPDEDGEDDEDDPFTLPTDPTTPAGDMASCMFENIFKV